MITAMVASDDNTEAVNQGSVVFGPLHNGDLSSPTVGFDPEWPRDCELGVPTMCPEPTGYLPAPEPGRVEPWTN